MPKARTRLRYTARTADKHELYEAAVQNPDADLDFVTRVYRQERGRAPRAIREDFCGTGYTSATWVRRNPANTAWGLDLDRKTLDWGRKRHVAPLTPEQRSRVTLLERNVLNPGPETSRVDAVLAMNFSYWIFKTRDDLRRYFEIVHGSMNSKGVFFLDHYGGWQAMRAQTDRKRCRGFTYLWEQRWFGPVTFDFDCRIHFEFPDGTKMRDAFIYKWRHWQIPEIRELLAETGFRKSIVYWEGDDDNGGGNGIYRKATNPEVCPVHLAYIVAVR
ncbi:MAG: class I SAM-dependent methyltransferase [Phycisphaerales bacterium]|nr:class I SAM-dependent methyltransferase [Phycisphaerales bacterium]